MASPVTVKRYLSLQSKSPRFAGNDCANVVLVSLTNMPHFGGRFPPGSAGAWRPPPVHVCTLASPLIMHWRVSCEPQVLATVAHRRNDDVTCSPSWDASPPVAFTAST